MKIKVLKKYLHKNKQTKQNRLIDTEIRWLPEGRGVGGLGEKSEGINNYGLAVTKQPQECEIQPREYS